MDGNGAPDEGDGSRNGKTPRIEVYGCKGMDIEIKGSMSLDVVGLGDELLIITQWTPHQKIKCKAKSMMITTMNINIQHML